MTRLYPVSPGNLSPVLRLYIFSSYPPLTSHTPQGYIGGMDQKTKQGITRRLKIVEGQVRGLRKMTEADKYCVDIITQSLAAKQALSGVEDAILENHLRTHVAHQMRSGETARATKEMVSLYKLSKKK